jgi:hypothetical protein
LLNRELMRKRRDVLAPMAYPEAVDLAEKDLK